MTKPVRDCSYAETPLKHYQAVVSPPDKPLALMRAERDTAWKKICEEIKKAVKEASATSPDKQKFIVTCNSSEITVPYSSTDLMVDSSAMWLLIHDKYYLAECVDDKGGIITVDVISEDGETDASIKALRPPQHGSPQAMSFAYGNDALIGDFSLITTSISCGTT